MTDFDDMMCLEIGKSFRSDEMIKNMHIGNRINNGSFNEGERLC